LTTLEEVDQKLWSVESWLFILVVNIQYSSALCRPFTIVALLTTTMYSELPIVTLLITIAERETRA
jgi:hypothetical protein